MLFAEKLALPPGTATRDQRIVGFHHVHAEPADPAAPQSPGIAQAVRLRRAPHMAVRSAVIIAAAVDVSSSAAGAGRESPAPVPEALAAGDSSPRATEAASQITRLTMPFVAPPSGSADGPTPCSSPQDVSLEAVAPRSSTGAAGAINGGSFTARTARTSLPRRKAHPSRGPTPLPELGDLYVAVDPGQLDMVTLSPDRTVAVCGCYAGDVFDAGAGRADRDRSPQRDRAKSMATKAEAAHGRTPSITSLQDSSPELRRGRRSPTFEDDVGRESSPLPTNPQPRSPRARTRAQTLPSDPMLSPTVSGAARRPFFGRRSSGYAVDASELRCWRLMHPPALEPSPSPPVVEAAGGLRIPASALSRDMLRNLTSAAELRLGDGEEAQSVLGFTESGDCLVRVVFGSGGGRQCKIVRQSVGLQRRGQFMSVLLSFSPFAKMAGVPPGATAVPAVASPSPPRGQPSGASGAKPAVWDLKQKAETTFDRATWSSWDPIHSVLAVVSAPRGVKPAPGSLGCVPAPVQVFWFNGKDSTEILRSDAFLLCSSRDADTCRNVELLTTQADPALRNRGKKGVPAFTHVLCQQVYSNDLTDKVCLRMTMWDATKSYKAQCLTMIIPLASAERAVSVYRDRGASCGHVPLYDPLSPQSPHSPRSPRTTTDAAGRVHLKFLLLEEHGLIAVLAPRRFVHYVSIAGDTALSHVFGCDLTLALAAQRIRGAGALPARSFPTDSRMHWVPQPTQRTTERFRHVAGDGGVHPVLVYPAEGGVFHMELTATGLWGYIAACLVEARAHAPELLKYAVRALPYATKADPRGEVARQWMAPLVQRHPGLLPPDFIMQWALHAAHAATAQADVALLPTPSASFVAGGLTRQPTDLSVRLGAFASAEFTRLDPARVLPVPRSPLGHVTVPVVMRTDESGSPVRWLPPRVQLEYSRRAVGYAVAEQNAAAGLNLEAQLGRRERSLRRSRASVQSMAAAAAQSLGPTTAGVLQTNTVCHHCGGAGETRHAWECEAEVCEHEGVKSSADHVRLVAPPFVPFSDALKAAAALNAEQLPTKRGPGPASAGGTGGADAAAPKLARPSGNREPPEYSWAQKASLFLDESKFWATVTDDTGPFSPQSSFASSDPPSQERLGAQEDLSLGALGRHGSVSGRQASPRLARQSSIVRQPTEQIIDGGHGQAPPAADLFAKKLADHIMRTHHEHRERLGEKPEADPSKMGRAERERFQDESREAWQMAAAYIRSLTSFPAVVELLFPADLLAAAYAPLSHRPARRTASLQPASPLAFGSPLGYAKGPCIGGESFASEDGACESGSATFKEDSLCRANLREISVTRNCLPLSPDGQRAMVSEHDQDHLRDSIPLNTPSQTPGKEAAAASSAEDAALLGPSPRRLDRAFADSEASTPPLAPATAQPSQAMGSAPPLGNDVAGGTLARGLLVASVAAGAPTRPSEVVRPDAPPLTHPTLLEVLAAAIDEAAAASARKARANAIPPLAPAPDYTSASPSPRRQRRWSESAEPQTVPDGAPASVAVSCFEVAATVHMALLRLGVPLPITRSFTLAELDVVMRCPGSAGAPLDGDGLEDFTPQQLTALGAKAASPRATLHRAAVRVLPPACLETGRFFGLYCATTVAMEPLLPPRTTLPSPPVGEATPGPATRRPPLPRPTSRSFITDGTASPASPAGTAAPSASRLTATPSVASHVSGRVHLDTRYTPTASFVTPPPSALITGAGPAATPVTAGAWIDAAVARRRQALLRRRRALTD